MINLRGRILPMVDLRTRFGIGGIRPEGTKIVITAIDDVTVGMVVDEVREALTLDAGLCEPAPAGAKGGHHVGAVAKPDGRLVVVLDLVRLLDEGALAA